jgi:uncharacterized protein
VSAGDWKEMFLAACAGDVELVRYHLDHGVDVDYAHPEFQSTALVASILAGHEPVAQVLLDHGADPLLVSPLEGQTPVEAARVAGLARVEARLRATAGAAPAPARPLRRGRRLTRRRTGRR